MKLWQITSSLSLQISSQSSQTSVSRESTEKSSAKSEYAKILAEKIASAREDMEQMNEIQEELDINSKLHEELTGKPIDEESKSTSAVTSEAATETLKRFMPDGSILIMKLQGGEIVEQFKKKPHLVAVADPSAPPTASGNVAVTLEVKQQLDLFSLI